MNDLIKVLTIFLKYANQHYPTQCEHDVLMVYGIHVDDVSEEDVNTLSKLSFIWDDVYDAFVSYRFGSA